MGINFPSGPVVGQLCPDPPLTGVPQYVWDGSAWVGAGAGSSGTPAGSNMVFAAVPFGNDNRVLRSDGTGRGAQSSSMFIDDSGNVGVSTTAPTFDAFGNRYFSVSGETLGLNKAGSIGAGGSFSNTLGAVGAMSFYNAAIAGANKSIAAIAGVLDGAIDSGALYLMTINAGGPLTTRVLIDHLGSVGIGTTSPPARLSVAGGTFALSNSATFFPNASWLGSFLDQGGNKGIAFGYPPDGRGNLIQGLTAGGYSHVVFNMYGGNVGIGTDTPTYALDVVRSQNDYSIFHIFNPHGGNAAHAVAVAENGTSNKAYWGVRGSGTPVAGLFNTSDAEVGGDLALSVFALGGPVKFAANGITEQMRLSTAGNLGVGTTGPQARLHVDSAITPTGNDDADHIVVISNQNSTRGDKRVLDIGLGANECAYFRPVGRNLAVLGGSLGIGTTTPGQALHVEGNIYLSGSVYAGGGSVQVWGWGGNSNAGVLFLNAATSRYLYYDGTNYSLPGAQLVLGADPTTPMGATTKQYVDARGGLKNTPAAFGWVDGGSAVAAINALIDAGYRDIVLTRGTYVIDANLTIPAGLLHFWDALFSINPGVTLTCYAEVIADEWRQLFSFPGDGSGSVVGIAHVVPDWFGNCPNNRDTDVWGIINRAITCMDTPWRTVERRFTWGPKVYPVSRGVIFQGRWSSPLHISGKGIAASEGCSMVLALQGWASGASAVQFVMPYGNYQCDFSMRDFEVMNRVKGGGPDGGLMFGGNDWIGPQTYAQNLVENVTVSGFQTGLYVYASRQIVFTRVGVWSGPVEAANPAAQQTENSTPLMIRSGSVITGPDGKPMRRDAGDVRFNDCQFVAPVYMTQETLTGRIRYYGLRSLPRGDRGDGILMRRGDPEPDPTTTTVVAYASGSVTYILCNATEYMGGVVFDKVQFYGGMYVFNINANNGGSVNDIWVNPASQMEASVGNGQQPMACYMSAVGANSFVRDIRIRGIYIVGYGYRTGLFLGSYSGGEVSSIWFQDNWLVHNTSPSGAIECRRQGGNALYGVTITGNQFFGAAIPGGACILIDSGSQFVVAGNMLTGTPDGGMMNAFVARIGAYSAINVYGNVIAGSAVNEYT